MKDRPSAVLAFLILAAVVVYLGIGWRDCTRAHGHYVRGLFGMECVK